MFGALSLELFSYARPFFSVDSNLLKEFVVFFKAPFIFVKIWVGMIDPSLSALLEGSDILALRLFVKLIGDTFPLYFINLTSFLLYEDTEEGNLMPSPFFSGVRFEGNEAVDFIFDPFSGVLGKNS